MSDRWQDVRAIVESALEHPAAARAAWLDEHCDPTMRDEVEDLIAACTSEQPFLEPPQRGTELAPDTNVGPFRIVRTIASGGMGTVYEAEQEKPHRRVALKMMRDGLMTPATRRRFRYEVETLGRLHHPAIAQVYETGVYGDDGGRPWFAMEFIEDAQPIVAFAANRPHQDKVRLFVEVCDAVQHGHNKGVLHRDLKPDNLLVDTHGRPKVIDFGVARAVGAEFDGATAHTRVGEIVGTLAYMSPEQVNGAAPDTRCDVYALGVVLYEMMCGGLPYALPKNDFLEAARTIRETPPRRSEALRGDLETIVLTCLDKAPARRYASAAELGADLRRYLAREPIAAHPPSVGYQLKMFARRNRTLVASAALVLVAATVATIVSVRYAIRADDSAQVANEESARSRKLLTTLLDRSVHSALRHAPLVLKLEDGARTSRAMVESALKDLANLERETSGDADAGAAIALAYVSLGDTLGHPDLPNLGDPAAARENYERALAFAQRIVTSQPDAGRARYAAALADDRIARLELAAGDGHGDKALALAQKRRDLCLKNQRRWPDQKDTTRDLVSAQYAVAGMHWMREEHQAALDAFAALQTYVDRIPRDDPQYLRAAAEAAFGRGAMLTELKQLAKSERWLETALRHLLALHKEQPDEARVIVRIGDVYGRLGSIASQRGQDPKEASPEPHVARALAWTRAGIAFLEPLEAAAKLPKKSRARLAILKARRDRTEKSMGSRAENTTGDKQR